MHVLMAFEKCHILDVWQSSEYTSVIVRTYVKIYQWQLNTNFIWQVVFDNLDKSLEYMCNRVQT